MAGKGRGRGFSLENQNLGFSRFGEGLQAISAPPTLFSPSISKSQPLYKGERIEVRAEILKKLLDRQKDDLYGINISSEVPNQSNMEKYGQSDKPKTGKYMWDKRLFPDELFSLSKKKLKNKAPLKKVKQMVDKTDVENKLKELEEKDDPAVEKKKDDDDDEEQESEAENEVMDDDDLDDDELLEESADYVSSYFDNGEGYLDEDENLDDDAEY